ncbi:hypothetical protein [Ammoniphilus sp. 3BR4]|uniref:hypothetical protein n=1 Tax=Ammoniphilus sp. 3BR4 TaxID=3158265 RepID=UPI003466AEE8
MLLNLKIFNTVEGLIREAMKLGVTHAGGLDPSLVDENMEKSFDIHLHEGPPTGFVCHPRDSRSNRTNQAKGQSDDQPRAGAFLSGTPEAWRKNITW